MKVSYFQDTDKFYIEFRKARVIGTKDLDENTIMDLYKSGNIISITLEHASKRIDVNQLTLSGITA